MKVNFAKIEIQGIENREILDVRKPLGNYLYYNSQDLEGSELGKRIYHSDAEKGIEISEKDKKLITGAIKAIYKSYVISTAAISALG